MACAHPVEKLAKQAVDFVVSNKGTWGHEDWESFCARSATDGVELNEHNRVALGNLLEALRYFYQLRPGLATAPIKRTATCGKKSAKKSAAI
jgi:hypothetical protein